MRLGYQSDAALQPSTETAVTRLVQTDITAVKNASLEMVITDFFHCEAVLDRAASSIQDLGL